MLLKDVPVIIVAGGFGMRMAPYNSVLPKPLLLHDGQVMIRKVLDNFKASGFAQFICLLHYQGKLIQTYLDTVCGEYDIQYVYEPTPLGTAGGLFLLKDVPAENFVVCNCDNLGVSDYADALTRHIENGHGITVFVKKKHYQIPFGIVHCMPTGSVSQVEEKPYCDFYISTGIHIINRKVLTLRDAGDVVSMPELINSSLEKYSVGYYDVGAAEWVDMSVRAME